MANFNPVNIEKALHGMDFPGDKGAVLAKARENGAGKEEIAALEGLPEREYNNPTEITQMLKEAEESGEEELDETDTEEENDEQ